MTIAWWRLPCRDVLEYTDAERSELEQSFYRVAELERFEFLETVAGR